MPAASLNTTTCLPPGKLATHAYSYTVYTLLFSMLILSIWTWWHPHAWGWT